jgi:hypothetical protein
MKKILSILFLLISLFAVGQDSISPINQFLLRKGYEFPDSTPTKKSTNWQWPDTLYYNTSYKSTLLGSITIPFLSSNIEIAKGIYSVTPAVNIGIGYTWFWGSFIFNEDDKITVDPKAFFGLVVNTGLQNGLNLKAGGLFISGFIGLGPFTLLFGYDIINRSPSLGIGGRIDLYTISQKYLHILGKVHPVRKPRKIAPMITPY